MEVAVLPERRFCMPAPESHRGVASLDLSASWRSHIPFGRSFSCQGAWGLFSPPSSLDNGVLFFSPVLRLFEKSSQFPIGRKKIKMDQRFFEIIKLFTFVPPLFYWYGNRANYKNFFLSLLLLVQKIRFVRYFFSHYSNGQKIDMGGHAFSLFLQNI